MTLHTLIILARQSGAAPKWLPALIIVGLWVFALLTAMIKKAAKSKAQQSMPTARRTNVPSSRSPVNMRPPPVPRRAAAQPARRGKSTAVFQAPPAPPRAASPAASAPALSPPAAPAVGAVRRPAPASINAATIARWLTPRVMRSQYILTEVFDPPPALREPEEIQL